MRDQGKVIGRFRATGIRPKFAWPDLSWEARLGRDWGYIEAAGIFTTDPITTPMEAQSTSSQLHGLGALLDATTDLPNRAMFMQVLEHEILQDKVFAHLAERSTVTQG